MDIETYIRRFPFRKSRITKTRYLRFIIEGYLHETYVLKERLIALLKIIEKSYRKTTRRERVERITKILSEGLLKHFERMAKIRGAHVHSYRFSTKQIDRLASLEYLVTSGNKGITETHLAFFKKLFNALYRDTQQAWLRNVEKTNTGIQKILDVYSEGLFQILFDKDGSLIYPHKPDA